MVEHIGSGCGRVVEIIGSGGGRGDFVCGGN